MCNSTNSICTISGVSCGNAFNVQVTSARGSCQSKPSQTAYVKSKPCPPSAPYVNNSCGDAHVSWTLSPVADLYHVVAVGENNTHSCNTTFNNCTLSSLHCDQNYSVSVIASHGNCSSIASPNATLYTGPCKPDNVSATYDCKKSSALLTWNENSKPVKYYASAVDDTGNMLYCHSNSSNCTFEGLQCGKTYNFTVLATDGTCNSSINDVEDSLGAVPCPPENLTVELLPKQSERQILSLSWSEDNCSNTEYLVKLTGNLIGKSDHMFDVSSYWTSETYFELPLPCGSAFNATVKAKNSAGTSEPSTIVTGTTAS
ncbi:fibronectin type III domain-containing protein 7-like [Periophthalmus magnuspinnatus]|uniref:fibronectin type III domain-containing protein 7-like n=1 Tax=Periophthalmus magnuspinnatus TaxID=409849 RepID=UPI002437278E|nr:fibronectin type III domain-containing protein 7-like [Periophthalmus magnuspinnatus]